MNLETVNTYEGTPNVHALILGRARPRRSLKATDEGALVPLTAILAHG